MNNEINIKIYRDGQYSFKDNLKLKAMNFLMKEAAIIDDFFTRPL